jgi:hypothetical protein
MMRFEIEKNRCQAVRKKFHFCFVDFTGIPALIQHFGSHSGLAPYFLTVILALIPHSGSHSRILAWHFIDSPYSPILMAEEKSIREFQTLKHLHAPTPFYFLLSNERPSFLFFSFLNLCYSFRYQ